jgi:hypothetical protein
MSVAKRKILKFQVSAPKEMDSSPASGHFFDVRHSIARTLKYTLARHQNVRGIHGGNKCTTVLTRHIRIIAIVCAGMYHHTFFKMQFDITFHNYRLYVLISPGGDLYHAATGGMACINARLYICGGDLRNGNHCRQDRRKTRCGYMTGAHVAVL